MKLHNFIDELEKISREVSNSNEVDVQMADCIPVVNPILKDGVVYITDVDHNTPED